MKNDLKKPATRDEMVEAIFEELSENEHAEDNSDKATLKTYVYDIHTLLRKESFQRKNKEEEANLYTSWSLGLLAFIALALITNSSQESPDFAWLQQNKFPIKLWGIALASIYVGASIEKTVVFNSLWKFKFTKLISSISLSGLFLFSTGKASGVINSVFGIDASSFPFTLAFTSSLIFFHYILPFMFMIGIVSFIHTFNAAGWIKSKIKESTYKLPPIHSFIFPVLSCFILFYAWFWSKNELSKEQLPQKVYKIAHLLDFNSNHQCSNIKDGVSVIYIGQSQNQVLADINRPEVTDMESFFEQRINVPAKFYKLNCELPVYSKQ